MSIMKSQEFLTNLQIEKVKQSGYEVEIIDDLNKIAHERRQEVSSINRFTTSNIVSEEITENVLGGYMTVDEIETALIQLSQQFPNFVTLIQLPNQTWEGAFFTCCAITSRNKYK